MKHIYADSLKPFLNGEIIATAKIKELTKEEAAEILAIDSRSFAYMKSGRTMCGAITLTVYLAKLCPDPMAFVEKARRIIDDIEENL